MASSMKVKLGTLSTGERLYLARRRLRETHHQAAERWGVCQEVYLNWEADRPGRLRPDMSKLPKLEPTPAESCMLARKRWNGKLGFNRKDKVNQGTLASILGLTRLWICRMECGREDCTRLVEYWNQQHA